MKISASALLFLILAAVLGPPAHAAQGGGSSSINHGVHRPGECCFSYTRRNITCTFMKDYFLTTSECSQPAVIFRTRGGQQVCADPHADGVQECVTKLASKSRLGSRYPVEELQ